MNKVITVNVFQGITVYLLRLFMSAGAGLRRRQAKVQFASLEYETIKHVLSDFYCPKPLFFSPSRALTSSREVMEPLAAVDQRHFYLFLYLFMYTAHTAHGGECCNMGNLTQHS